MNSRTYLPADREHALDEIIAAYDRATRPNQAEWLARYPSYATELVRFFADRDGMKQLAGACRSDDVSTGAYQPVQDDAAATGTCPPISSAKPITSGTLLAGRYRVFDVKAGGMGVVYLAEDIKAPAEAWLRRIALKTVMDYASWQDALLRKGHSPDPIRYANLVTRFRREALTWVRLGKHVNIIHAVWVEDIGGRPYLKMEYADSGDLGSWIAEGRLRIPLVVNFALQFCAGMMHARRTCGVVHRDIKPANVLIHDQFIVKISDFGLARAFAESDDSTHKPIPSTDRTLSVHGGGTRPYMPPEQFRSLADTDERSDIFAFGAMLYEMLTGNKLFWPISAWEMVMSGVTPSEAHGTNSRVPPALSAIVSRCVAFDPAQRFPSFAAVQAELRDFESRLFGRIPYMPEDAAEATAHFADPSQQILSECYSLIHLGQFAEAETIAREGIRIDPASADHWNNLGRVLKELRRTDEAVSCCRRATELQPHLPDYWANLGWVLYELGDALGARNAAERAIAVDPSFANGWACLGLAQVELDQFAAAVDSLNRATRLAAQSWELYAKIGECLNSLTRFAEAEQPLRTAVEMNPNDAESWFQLAAALSEKGDRTGTRHAIDRCLEINPRHTSAWIFRGRVAWQRERDAVAARTCLDTAIRLLADRNAPAELIADARAMFQDLPS